MYLQEQRALTDSTISTCETLQQALVAASPRLSPPPMPIRAVLIHGTVTLLWVALFARAFVVDNVFAWSAGIVYVAYDTALLVFVFCQTLDLIRPKLPTPGARRTSIAVIVAAHNEASVLPITLAALNRPISGDAKPYRAVERAQHHHAHAAIPAPSPWW